MGGQTHYVANTWFEIHCQPLITRISLTTKQTHAQFNECLQAVHLVGLVINIYLVFQS